MELTEGVHFTLDQPNFRILGITPHWKIASTYTVRYNHVATPALPAHGILLSSAVTSDANGVYRFRVRYGGSLAGEKDFVSASVEV